MKLKFKFVHFEPCSDPLEKVWDCWPNDGGASLGAVEWYETDHRHYFHPEVFEKFELGHLDEIAAFMRQLRVKYAVDYKRNKDER